MIVAHGHAPSAVALSGLVHEGTSQDRSAATRGERTPGRFQVTTGSLFASRRSGRAILPRRRRPACHTRLRARTGWGSWSHGSNPAGMGADPVLGVGNGGGMNRRLLIGVSFRIVGGARPRAGLVAHDAGRRVRAADEPYGRERAADIRRRYGDLAGRGRLRLTGIR